MSMLGVSWALTVVCVCHGFQSKLTNVVTTGLFEDRPTDFSSIFRRLLALTLDTTQPAVVRTHLISFFLHAFQSLDRVHVRKECVPLVSIAIWHNLSSETLRETKLSQDALVRKAWRASLKRYDAADDDTKARLRFERSWLYTLVLDFIRLIYADEHKSGEFVLSCPPPINQ